MEPIEHSFIEGVFTIKEVTNLNIKVHETYSIQYVYGIVQSVFESNFTKFKHIHLIDDSYEEGIYINTKKFLEKILVRSIVKINSLSITKIAEKIEYFFDHHSSATFIPLFTFDYDNVDITERNKILNERFFNNYQDRTISKKLEEWYSLKIFQTNLSNIHQDNAYFNLACQVLCYTKSVSCISALIWDGTNPNYSLPICIFNDANEPNSFHLDGFNFRYFSFTLGRYFLLNVWKEDSKFSVEHYEKFKCLNLKNNEDLLVLFNVQLVHHSLNPGACSLAMRSTMKCGKAVRLCNRNSILGKMLMKRIEAFIEISKQTIYPNSVIDSPLLMSLDDENKWSEEETEILSQYQDIENDTSLSVSNISEHAKQEKQVENVEKTEKKQNDSEECLSFSHGSSNELRILKEKGKPYIVYESLLKMGLHSLHEYYKLQENTEDEDGFYPITKDERLKLIQYAINELRGNISSKSFSISDVSISISNSYDSFEELDTP